jgi:hypothetical protein
VMTDPLFDTDSAEYGQPEIGPGPVITAST